MARVRYEHGFKWDVFISYSHQDNQKPEGWVRSFELRLQERLDQLTGKEIRIWRDARRIGPGGVLDSAICAALEETAVFLMVLSPNWLASDWCPRELALFRSLGAQESGSRSRVMAIERYPVERYPDGVRDTLISHFFQQLEDGSPVHLLVNETLKTGDAFEAPFSKVAGNLAGTLAALERTPVRRPGKREGAVWFAPVGTGALNGKLAALKAQVAQAGFGVAGGRDSATVEVRLVGSEDPAEGSEPGPGPPQLTYVDPAAGDAGLGAQMIRERAGRNGVEVLTDWPEFQDRLEFRLNQPEPPRIAPRTLISPRGARVYFVFDDADCDRAVEVSKHLYEAGCRVETQMAESPRVRTNQNRVLMERSDGVLVLLGKCSRDWAAIQLRHLVQFAPEGKGKGLFLDDPESSSKSILKQRPDVLVLDGIGGKDALPLLRRFLENLPGRVQ